MASVRARLLPRENFHRGRNLAEADIDDEWICFVGCGLRDLIPPLRDHLTYSPANESLIARARDQIKQPFCDFRISTESGAISVIVTTYFLDVLVCFYTTPDDRQISSFVFGTISNRNALDDYASS